MVSYPAKGALTRGVRKLQERKLSIGPRAKLDCFRNSKKFNEFTFNQAQTSSRGGPIRQFSTNSTSHPLIATYVLKCVVYTSRHGRSSHHRSTTPTKIGRESFFLSRSQKNVEAEDSVPDFRG